VPDPVVGELERCVCPARRSGLAVPPQGDGTTQRACRGLSRTPRIAHDEACEAEARRAIEREPRRRPALGHILATSGLTRDRARFALGHDLGRRQAFALLVLI
jgi:hypothetical protein